MRNNLQDPQLGNQSIKFTVDRKSWIAKAHNKNKFFIVWPQHTSASVLLHLPSFKGILRRKQVRDLDWCTYDITRCVSSVSETLFWFSSDLGKMQSCSALSAGLVLLPAGMFGFPCTVTELCWGLRYGRCSQFVVQGSVSHCH